MKLALLSDIHANRQLIAQQGGQELNYDVPADRAIILNQRWNPLAPLLVLG